MTVVLVRAEVSAKPVLRRLLELNAHDFSAFDGRDVNEHGEFGYGYLDHYWTEPDERRAWLFHCDGPVAGFGLARKGPPHTVAEFFVLRKYRRTGVGAAAVSTIFATWPGEWMTHQVQGNDAAVAFWRSVIPAGYTEQVGSEGTTQRFQSG